MDSASSAPTPVDRDYLAARASVLDVAAYLDRVARAGAGRDFRHQALLSVLPLLTEDPAPPGGRVAAILDALSDPTTDPHPGPPLPPACGAPLPETAA